MLDEEKQAVTFTRRSGQRIADVVRKVEGYGHPPRNWYRRNHRGSDDYESAYHFQVLLGDMDPSSGYYLSLKVRCGFWNRRGIKTLLEKDGGGTSEDLNEYQIIDLTLQSPGSLRIFLRLKGFNTNPGSYCYLSELFPETSLEIFVSNTDNPNTWNDLWLIGTLDWDGVSVNWEEDFQQKWFGGNIEDFVSMTDTDVSDCEPGGGCCDVGRYTIEENPQESFAEGARQLRNVHCVACCGYWTPYFYSCGSLDGFGNIRGDLCWAAYDSMWPIDGSNQCSIEVVAKDGKEVVQAFHFQCAAEHTVPYKGCDSGPNRSFFCWEYPVATVPGPDPHDSTPWRFPVPGDMDGLIGVDVRGTGSSSDGSVQVILVGHEAQIVDGRLEVGESCVETCATFGLHVCWEHGWCCCLPQCWICHCCLGFASASPAGGQNVDHDCRYFIRGGDWCQNYGQSIGYGTDPNNCACCIIIDLANRKLFSNNTCRMDWESEQLIHCDGIPTVQWGDLKLSCYVGCEQWSVMGACLWICGVDEPGCCDPIGAACYGSFFTCGGIHVRNTSLFQSSCQDWSIHILDCVCGCGSCGPYPYAIYVESVSGTIPVFGLRCDNALTVVSNIKMQCCLSWSGCYFDNCTWFALEYDPSCNWLCLHDTCNCIQAMFEPSYFCLMFGAGGTFCFADHFCAECCVIAGCDVGACGIYYQSTHAGVNTGDEVCIPKTAGGFITARVRGGIITED